MKKFLILLILILGYGTGFTQFRPEPPKKPVDPIVQKIMDEAYNNSQLEVLAHELLDDIGPRLVGTPQMQQAHDWAVDKYKSWGIEAENQQWGVWRGWERGVTHIDMMYPRLRTLAGTQNAWNPSTPPGGITAEVIVLPTDIKDSASFNDWLPNVEGKFVMIAMKQPTGWPDGNWEKWATPETFEKMKKKRDEITRDWNQNIQRSGYSRVTLVPALEKAGAAGIIDSYWSQALGSNKIFGARTKTIPSVDLHLEDYGLLYRMAEHGDRPRIRIVAESKELGEVPTFNTIARIEGKEKPNEYVVLSAHFDSWDGGTGATDNGTGTLVMMEALRILNKVYPNPKRTILVGHWGSEEQGLNGSSAFVADHPEIVDHLQAGFNQDNGTGRVVKIDGAGFLHSYDYLSRWLRAVPDTIRKHIETTFPGTPATGGTDHASFNQAGAPAFGLTSLSWNYWDVTWHTNLDTYDKIIFDEVQNNVILTATLAYMASEDPETTSREHSVLPPSPWTGEPMQWPSPRKPQRRGGLD